MYLARAWDLVGLGPYTQYISENCQCTYVFFTRGNSHVKVNECLSLLFDDWFMRLSKGGRTISGDFSFLMFCNLALLLMLFYL